MGLYLGFQRIKVAVGNQLRCLKQWIKKGNQCNLPDRRIVIILVSTCLTLEYSDDMQSDDIQVPANVLGEFSPDCGSPFRREIFSPLMVLYVCRAAP